MKTSTLLCGLGWILTLQALILFLQGSLEKGAVAVTAAVFYWTMDILWRKSSE